MKTQSLNIAGKMQSAEIVEELFSGDVNYNLIAQAVRVYQSNLRQASSVVKTRGEVARTKKKWFKQKGTGNARHGARSAPIFVGGGVAHGPKKDHHYKLNLSTQMKRKALLESLKAQAQKKAVFIASDFDKLSGKTTQFAKMLSLFLQTINKDNQNLEIKSKNPKILVVTGSRSEALERASANIENVLTVASEYLTALEVSLADIIFITKDAQDALIERLNSVIAVKKEN